ncbi:hypothetical protein [Streptomyces luteireticuli]
MAVASMETHPVATVSQEDPNAMEEVDRQWRFHASTVSLMGADGEFLMSVAGRGSREVGWLPVKWSKDSKLAATLRCDGDPEFVAMSMDGRFLCAVTTEEYDYWIVVHRFD